MNGKCVVLCLAALLVTGTAFAANLNPTEPACEGSSLISYVDGANTGGCSVGPFVIDQVHFQGVGTGGATPANFNDLLLLTNWNGNTLTLSLQGFNCGANPHDENHPGPCDVTDDQGITYTFSFLLDPAPIIDSMDVSMDPPFGNIVGGLNYCGNPIAGAECPTPISGSFTPTSSFFQSFIRSPLSVISGTTTITLGGGPAGFDGVIYSYGTSLPEPGTWALLGSSLIALGGFSRRRRR